MNKREYTLVCDNENGCYYLVLTHYRHVAVMGVGGTRNRKKALREAREHCRNTQSILHIERGE